MTKIVKTRSGKSIQIQKTSFASGGQGSVHNILNPSMNEKVAKIYNDPSKINNLESKLRFMVTNNPTTNSSPIIKQSLAWPEQLLYNNKDEFIGYIMPKISDSIELTNLTIPKPPQIMNGMDWAKFDMSNPISYKIRLTVCYNIGKAVELLHRSRLYTIVDLKPDNIMVNKDGIVSIIDIDSIQVSDKNGMVKFHADVCTEEYAPPEYYLDKIYPSQRRIDTSWDAFSYATICYRLMFNIHPFQSSHIKFKTIPELIKNHMFVHGKNKNTLKVVPHLHDNFYKIDSEIRHLFIRCYESGHIYTNKRPSIFEWVNTLEYLLRSNSLKKIKLSSVHSKKNYKNSQKAKAVIPPIVTYNVLYFSNTAEITWTTQNVQKCFLDGNSVNTNGKITIPIRKKDYTLKVVGLDGTTISRTVKIQIPKPQIISFTINHGLNGISIISWRTRNADSAKLNGFNVSLNGSKKGILILSEYTLMVKNRNSSINIRTIKNKNVPRTIKIKTAKTNIKMSAKINKSRIRIIHKPINIKKDLIKIYA